MEVAEGVTCNWAVTARVVITGTVKATDANDATKKLGAQLRALRGLTEDVHLTVVDVHTARKLA